MLKRARRMAVLWMVFLLNMGIIKQMAYPPLQAQAASVGETKTVTTAGGLMEAMMDTTVGNIILQNDIGKPPNCPGVITGRELTIDLNGFGFRGCIDWFFQAEAGGTIIFKNGSLDEDPNEITAMHAGNGGHIVIEPSVQMVSNPSTGIFNIIPYVNNGGKITINGTTYTSEPSGGSTMRVYSQDYILSDGDMTIVYKGNLDTIPAEAMRPDGTPVYLSAGCSVNDTNGEYVLSADGWYGQASQIIFEEGAGRGDLKIMNDTPIEIETRNAGQKIFAPLTVPAIGTDVLLDAAEQITKNGTVYYQANVPLTIRLANPRDYTFYNVSTLKKGSPDADKIFAVSNTDKSKTVTISTVGSDLAYEMAEMTEAQENIHYTVSQGGAGIPSGYDPNTTYLTNVISLHAASGNGIFNEEETAIGSSMTLKEEGKNITKTFYTIKNTPGDLEYGREYKGTITYSMDYSAPVIHAVTQTIAEGGYVTGDVSVAIEATDTVSGLLPQPYSFDGGTTWQAENTKVYPAGSQISAQNIWVKDIVGNIAKYPSAVDVYVDKNPTADADIYRLEGAQGKNGWYTSDVVLVPKDGFLVSTGENAGYVQSMVFSKTTKGVSLYFKQPATGMITKPVSLSDIKIDKTAPKCNTEEGIRIGSRSWQNFAENITFQSYYNKPMTAVIKGHEEESSIAGTSYFISPKGLTKGEVVLHSSFQNGSSLTLDSVKPASMVIYARIENEAGLVTYVSSDGIIMDKAAPSISGAVSGKVYKEDHLKIKVTDYRLNSVYVNNKLQTIKGNEFNITLKANNTDQKYTIKAYDKSKNVKEITFTLSRKAEKTEIKDSGKVKMEEGVPYSFSSGKWTVSGDSSVYFGGSTFYVLEDGEYSLTKSADQ